MTITFDIQINGTDAGTGSCTEEEFAAVHKSIGYNKNTEAILAQIAYDEANNNHFNKLHFKEADFTVSNVVFDNSKITTDEIKGYLYLAGYAVCYVAVLYGCFKLNNYTIRAQVRKVLAENNS